MPVTTVDSETVGTVLMLQEVLERFVGNSDMDLRETVVVRLVERTLSDSSIVQEISILPAEVA